jgi:carbon starvation protein
LLQEILAKVHPSLGLKGKGPGGIVATALIVLGWAYFMNVDSFSTIWAIFGIANQTLAVIALAVVAAWMANSGKSRYLLVPSLPMLFVLATTSLATVQILHAQYNTLTTQMNAAIPDRTLIFRTWTQMGLLTAMMACMVIALVASGRRVVRA